MHGQNIWSSASPELHIRNITDPKDGNNVNAKKYVYFFGDGIAEGSARMKSLLGSKGANLAEMTNIDIPVPPGFTISTEAYNVLLCKRWRIPGRS